MGNEPKGNSISCRVQKCGSPQAQWTGSWVIRAARLGVSSCGLIFVGFSQHAFMKERLDKTSCSDTLSFSLSLSCSLFLYLYLSLFLSLS